MKKKKKQHLAESVLLNFDLSIFIDRLQTEHSRFTQRHIFDFYILNAHNVSYDLLLLFSCIDLRI